MLCARKVAGTRLEDLESLGKSLCLSGPQFHWLWNGDNNNTISQGLYPDETGG